MSLLRERLDALAAVREETLAALTGLTEAELERPAAWRSGTLDVRFLLLQLADADDERRLRLRRVLDGAGRRQSQAQAILGDAALTRGRLLGALVGVGEQELDRSPAPGEWSLREVIGHIITTEQRYTVHSRYAAERPERVAAGGDGGPLRPPNHLLPPLSGAGLAAGTPAAIRRELAAARAETLETLAGCSDEQLALPTDWLGIEFDLRFRLHRFAAHERQHLVQVSKTLQGIGFRHTEAQLILAEAEQARAQLIALTVGLPDAVAAHGDPSALDVLADAEAGERSLVAAIRMTLLER